MLKSQNQCYYPHGAHNTHYTTICETNVDCSATDRFVFTSRHVIDPKNKHQAFDSICKEIAVSTVTKRLVVIFGITVILLHVR